MIEIHLNWYFLRILVNNFLVDNFSNPKYSNIFQLIYFIFIHKSSKYTSGIQKIVGSVVFIYLLKARYLYKSQDPVYKYLNTIVFEMWFLTNVEYLPILYLQTK